MKDAETNQVNYEVIRSSRATADIIIERDGSVLIRASEWADDELKSGAASTSWHRPRTARDPLQDSHTA